MEDRSSHRRCSATKGVLRKAQVSSCEFFEISKNTFFIEDLWVTASKKKKFMRVFLHYYYYFFFCQSNSNF